MKKKIKIIWAANLNSQYKISNGRKISKKKAVLNPTANEIYEAAKSLNMSPTLENEKQYPKLYWKEKGRVVINKVTMKKKEMLIKIAKMIKDKRK